MKYTTKTSISYTTILTGVSASHSYTPNTFASLVKTSSSLLARSTCSSIYSSTTSSTNSQASIVTSTHASTTTGSAVTDAQATSTSSSPSSSTSKSAATPYVFNPFSPSPNSELLLGLELGVFPVLITVAIAAFL